MNREEILNLAYELMKGLAQCDDEDFVDEVIEAIRYNDEYALGELCQN